MAAWIWSRSIVRKRYKQGVSLFASETGETPMQSERRMETATRTLFTGRDFRNDSCLLGGNGTETIAWRIWWRGRQYFQSFGTLVKNEENVFCWCWVSRISFLRNHVWHLIYWFVKRLVFICFIHVAEVGILILRKRMLAKRLQQNKMQCNRYCFVEIAEYPDARI